MERWHRRQPQVLPVLVCCGGRDDEERRRLPSSSRAEEGCCSLFALPFRPLLLGPLASPRAARGPRESMAGWEGVVRALTAPSAGKRCLRTGETSGGPTRLARLWSKEEEDKLSARSLSPCALRACVVIGEAVSLCVRGRELSLSLKWGVDVSGVGERELAREKGTRGGGGKAGAGGSGGVVAPSRAAAASALAPSHTTPNHTQTM